MAPLTSAALLTTGAATSVMPKWRKVAKLNVAASAKIRRRIEKESRSEVTLRPSLS